MNGERSSPSAVAPAAGSEIEQILDLARWAPSGDNSQPWRFTLFQDDGVLVSVTCDDDIYDFNDGQPTLISAGMLLETMRLAASRFGRAMDWTYVRRDGTTHRIEVRLRKDPAVKEGPLTNFITIRSVDRRPYRSGRLTLEQKNALTQALGPGLQIRWYETFAERLRAARLNARSTDVRLRLRSAHTVHQRIIDWESRFSPSGIPAEAIGLDPMTLRLMRWMMGDWQRIAFMNRLPGATGVPQLEMDLLPGIFCAAHFTVDRTEAPAPGDEIASLLRGGEELQKFWLTATSLRLAMQPAFAPINFAFHGTKGERLRDTPAIEKKARALARELSEAEGFDPARTLFRGRLGSPARNKDVARSMRKPLSELMG